MKYKIIVDSNNYITSYYNNGSGDETFEFDFTTIDTNHLNCYKFVNNTISLDENKYNETIAKEEEDAKKQEKENQKLEAQILYTAVCTDTLLESEVE